MKTRYAFDTEFDEDGRTIELISIGIASDDGREYYACSKEFDPLHCNAWVKENVLVHLPPPGDPAWKSRAQIRDEVKAFAEAGRWLPEFWAYYADYDWVVLCQLFGRMVDLPPTFPKHCKDLKQLLDTYENIRKDDLPPPEGPVHHALTDARWVMQGILWIQKYC